MRALLKMIASLAVLLLSVVVSRADPLRLSRDEVVAIARDAGAAAGYDMSEFVEPEPKVGSVSQHTYRWDVYFSPRVGARTQQTFWVYVDDRTKKAILTPHQ
jgi:hypothetical protein